MNKRAGLCIILILLISLAFSACTQERKIDRYEFSLRLERIDAAYSIKAENIIAENEKQHIFYSLAGEDDCLLTLNIDSSDKLESVSLTIAKENWTQGGILEYFLPFCKTALSAFCFNNTELAENAGTQLGLNNINSYFSDVYEKLESGNYKFTLFSNENSVIVEAALHTEIISE